VLDCKGCTVFHSRNDVSTGINIFGSPKYINACQHTISCTADASSRLLTDPKLPNIARIADLTLDPFLFVFQVVQAVQIEYRNCLRDVDCIYST
jgi:hypothetical protein